jgi:hypothetical protein
MSEKRKTVDQPQEKLRKTRRSLDGPQIALFRVLPLERAAGGILPGNDGRLGRQFPTIHATRLEVARVVKRTPARPRAPASHGALTPHRAASILNPCMGNGILSAVRMHRFRGIRFGLAAPSMELFCFRRAFSSVG